MTRARYVVSVYGLLVLAAVAFGGCYALPGKAAVITESVEMQRPPRIRPDYTGTVIPPNIAPLNFRIEEAGTRYQVAIHGAQGEGIVTVSNTPDIVIPIGKWRALLEMNKGGELLADVYVKGTEGQWRHFDTIKNTVAAEPIDPYIAYRRMKPWYTQYGEMGLYQRHIEDYEESLILNNRMTPGSCMNCHSVSNPEADRMIIHLRFPFVMLSVHRGGIQAIDTRTDFNKSAFAYTAWHPNGHMAAFSFNKILQLFHTKGETRDAVDFASNLLLYNFDTNTVSSAPVIADPAQYETFPAWSPDGRYLYFCSAPAVAEEDIKLGKEVQYSLLRVPFDPETGAWGGRETVVAADALGMSIAAPRVSPDGRFVLFTAARHGTFPIFQDSADLYLLDIATGQCKPLECNSPLSDSWHEWSGNGRWIAFSSKRDDGLFTKLYFSYVDEQGKTHKPWLLPQESPRFYDGFLEVYSVPEFLQAPVKVRPRDLATAVHAKPTPAQLDTGTRALTGTPAQTGSPGQESAYAPTGGAHGPASGAPQK